jgi:hypothetical protein
LTKCVHNPVPLDVVDGTHSAAHGLHPYFHLSLAQSTVPPNLVARVSSTKWEKALECARIQDMAGQGMSR